MIPPRKSRVLRQLRAGRRALSYKSNLNCSRPVEIAAQAGFDCVWVCQEHVGTDFSTLEKQILAGKAYDVDVVVRVAKGSYSDYIRPLELDAAGIMVPHLMDLGEAEALVRATRFAPQGLRPVDGGNADGMFCRLPLAEYLRFANEQRMLIVQIEDPEPLPQLADIAGLGGIDMLFFGPGDFSQAIGRPGDFDHPEIARVRRLVAETARRYGKFAGTVATPETLAAYFDLGYHFLNCGADVRAIGADCDGIVQAARNGGWPAGIAAAAGEGKAVPQCRRGTA